MSPSGSTEGKKSGPATTNEHKEHPSGEADHGHPGGCQKGDQHLCMQGESQTHDFSMHDGVRQPDYSMQGNFQHQGQPMKRGIHDPLNSMQGGLQQPGYFMQGGIMQQPGYFMQGGMQQPGYFMQGGMQQPGYFMQGGMQQPGYFVQGGMQQPGYFMQGGMQQPGYFMHGGMQQQPGYFMQGGMQQRGYFMQEGMQQPGYFMQAGMQQPGFLKQGANRPAGFTMQGKVQQTGYAMQERVQQSHYPMHGAVQQPSYPTHEGNQQLRCPMQQGAVQQPGYPMQGGGQEPGYPMQRVVQKPGHPKQEAGQQSGYPRLLGGIQEPGCCRQPGYDVQEKDPQPLDTSQGVGPQAISSVQPYQVYTDRDEDEEHQPNQKWLIKEKRPNNSFSETDWPQKLSKLPQPHSKAIHKINFAVEPAVLEYILSSRHNEDLKKLTEARKCTLTWNNGSNNAVLEYSGKKDESWETVLIANILSFLQTFEKFDFPVHEEIWKEVEAEQHNLRTILGRDPPFLECIPTKYTLRIVASKNDIEGHKELLKTKIEKMYSEATFLKKSITNISKGLFSLLKVVNFCEKLREQYPDVELDLDPEKGEIDFKGPRDQVGIAMQKFRDQQRAANKTHLRLNHDRYRILVTTEGKSAIEKALKDENIKAVAEYGEQSVMVLGSSEAHAKKAASIVSEIVTEETILLITKHFSLMASEGWRKYCKEIQEKMGVLIQERKQSRKICVVGFKNNAINAALKLQFYLNNAEIEEEIECNSVDVKTYLLRYVPFGVKVRDVKGSLNFRISGRDQTLKKAADEINKLSKEVAVSRQVFDQPGIRNFLKKGDLDVRIKKIEDQENCSIRIEKNLGPTGTTSPFPAVDGATSGFVTSSGSNTLVTTHGHKLCWKSGDIIKEQVR